MDLIFKDECVESKTFAHLNDFFIKETFTVNFIQLKITLSKSVNYGVQI